MHKTFPGAKIIHDKRRQSAGWTVADVVLHLAQSEEAVTAMVTRVRTGLGAVAGGTMDERAGEAVRREWSAPPEVFCRRQRALAREALFLLVFGLRPAIKGALLRQFGAGPG